MRLISFSRQYSRARRNQQAFDALWACLQDRGRVFNETINPNTSVGQRKSCEMCPWPGRVIRTTRWCVDDKLNSICLSKRATWESNRRLQLYTAALLKNVCNAKKTNAFPLRRKRFINFIPISFQRVVKALLRDCCTVAPPI